MYADYIFGEKERRDETSTTLCQHVFHKCTSKIPQAIIGLLAQHEKCDDEK